MTSCISDRCLEYLNEFKEKLDKITGWETKKDKESYKEYGIYCLDDFWHDVYELYNDLRVDGFIGNHNPKSIAVGIIKTIQHTKERMDITLRDLDDVSGINENTIRENYKKIIKHLSKSQPELLELIVPRNNISSLIKGKYEKRFCKTGNRYGINFIFCKQCDFKIRSNEGRRKMFDHIKEKHIATLEKGKQKTKEDLVILLRDLRKKGKSYDEIINMLQV